MVVSGRGGGGNYAAPLTATGLTDVLKQQVIVDNRGMAAQTSEKILAACWH